MKLSRKGGGVIQNERCVWRCEVCSCSNVCLHLSLTPCCPLPCTTTTRNEKESTKKRRLVQQENSSSRKMACNVKISWGIEKVLPESDFLRVTCRLLVGKKCVEAFDVPIFGGDDVETGVNVKTRDYDTHSVHSLVFKKCSSGSYGFGRNWMKVEEG
ncbi:hypothetical protein L195_g053379 [Trifolium pratense]|uniref:B3 domain-containing protein n=1 Tax=Trifolium pratense TaxID=57577 RepID=A0A2K3KA96_TRIPR|nr:B3 domain-containing protein [Trifolium pratense]PNX63189.1 hypothetical protein L195_g053379 [Trifolium pratense]